MSGSNSHYIDEENNEESPHEDIIRLVESQKNDKR